MRCGMDFSRYEAWIFDFDYTLCDATAGIVKAYNETFREFGMDERPEDVIRSTVGLTVPESFMIMTGSTDTELAQKFFESFLRTADKIMTANTKYLPGSYEFLRALFAAGKPRAVVTTKMSYRITDFFAKQGEPELIDFVIGYQEVANKKPAPDGLIAARARLERDYGIPGDDVVYVGDNEVDARAAQAAGMDFIGVTTGTTPAEILASYPHVAIVTGMHDLLQSI